LKIRGFISGPTLGWLHIKKLANSLNDVHIKYIPPASMHTGKQLMLTGKHVKSQEAHICQLRLKLSVMNICLEITLIQTSQTTSNLSHILSWHSTSTFNPLKLHKICELHSKSDKDLVKCDKTFSGGWLHQFGAKSNVLDTSAFNIP
jgi:hypothetical protein